MAGVRTYAGLMLAGIVVVAAADRPRGQQAQFRATTDFVFRDVRVFDGRGRVVMDLGREDFRVVEDGLEQKIEWFVRSAGNQIITDEQPKRAQTEGLILPAVKPAAEGDGRILVIFIDDLHLQARDSPGIQNVLRLLRDEIVKPNDRIAIVSSGYSSIEQNLTLDPDHARLDAAIKKVMGSAPTPADVIAAASTAEGPAGLRYNAHVAFGTAYSVLEQLEKLPGRRKAFFYVSNGYDFNPFESSRLKAEMDRSSVPGQRDSTPQVNPFESRGTQFADSDLARELLELIRAANRANTTFYPIDPRGLIGGPDIDVDLSPTEWWKFVSSGINSLQVLASETMGRAVVNTNGFAQAFRRIDAELSDYYVLGYQSTNRDPLRRTRQVTITVSRPGLRLEYQTKYSLRPR
ncbi:MAG TPA: VWA domain-containing protein [Vicinamibacterales bacterium]